MEDNSKVDFSRYFELRGENMVLSKLCGVPSAKRARLARNTSNPKARGEKPVMGSFSPVNHSDKMQARDRTAKFPEMCKMLTEFILFGWHTGSPVSREACYTNIRVMCKKESGFY